MFLKNTKMYGVFFPLVGVIFAITTSFRGSILILEYTIDLPRETPGDPGSKSRFSGGIPRNLAK